MQNLCACVPGDVFPRRERASDRAEGGILDGIPGQDVEVHRLRQRLRLYCRRAIILLRQTIQERTQALQDLQGKANIRSRSGSLGIRAVQG